MVAADVAALAAILDAQGHDTEAEALYRRALAHGEFLPQRRPETVEVFLRACCRAECNYPGTAYT
jgi:hypothetical protein